MAERLNPVANRNDNIYDIFQGNLELSKINRAFAWPFVILAALFMVMTRSFFSYAILTYGVLTLIFLTIQIKFYDTEKKQMDHYLTFLFFNEWRTWFGIFSFSFLLGVIGNFLFPLYIAASDKTYWDNSYWGNMYYEVYFGFFITFLIIFAIYFGVIAGQNLYLFHMWEGSIGENLDRTISSVIIIELLCTLGFACILKFEGIWLTSYLAILLYVLIGISIVFLLPCLYYGIVRNKEESITNVQLLLFVLFILFFLFHCCMAIILFSNVNVAYSRPPAVYSYGFDSEFLKNVAGEDKFVFVGDVEEITKCPSFLSVYNWEDPVNQFGCISMKAFYKGRTGLCLLLDLLLALPVFEAVLIYSLSDIDSAMPHNDEIKASALYAKFQEKFRIIVSWSISIAIISATLTILCIGPFSNSAKFIYEQVDPVNINSEGLYAQVIPNIKNGLTHHTYPDTATNIYPTINTSFSIDLFDENDNNSENDIILEYTLKGTITHNQVLQLKLFYFPTDAPTELHDLLITTNTLFVIDKLFPNPLNNPKQYTYRITDPSTQEQFRTGTFVVGGLLSGRNIQFGDVILKPNENLFGVIKGSAYEATNSLTPIRSGKVLVVKGRYYPSKIDEIIDNGDDFNLKEARLGEISLEGIFVAFDLPLGEHTLLVYSPGYYVEVMPFVITDADSIVDLERLYLVKKDPSIAFTIKLEWLEKSVNLHLYSSFKSKSSKQCLIGYLNKECSEGKMTSYEDEENADTNSNLRYEMISFGHIGANMYSFYVHNHRKQSGDFIKQHFTEGFMSEDPADNTGSVLDIGKTNARVKVYIKDIRIALLNDLVPIEATGKRWNVFHMDSINNVLQFTIMDELLN